MAIEVIPTRTDLSAYKELILLGDTYYALIFQWNSRDEAWYLDIKTQGDAPIAVGIKMVTDWVPLAQLKNPLLPEGVIMAVDLSGAYEEPDRESMNNRTKVLYITED